MEGVGRGDVCASVCMFLYGSICASVEGPTCVPGALKAEWSAGLLPKVGWGWDNGGPRPPGLSLLGLDAGRESRAQGGDRPVRSHKWGEGNSPRVLAQSCRAPSQPRAPPAPVPGLHPGHCAQEAEPQHGIYWRPAPSPTPFLATPRSPSVHPILSTF